MIKTEELVAPMLDFYVAKCEHMPVKILQGQCVYVGPVNTWAPKMGSYEGLMTGQLFNPSSRHGIGGIIIDREGIATKPIDSGVQRTWHASTPNHAARGPTRLIAAMRCYVASKLGDEVPKMEDDPVERQLM